MGGAGRGRLGGTCLLCVVLFFVGLALSSPVRADERGKRPTPDLDGRPPSDEGVAVLWIPRIALAPLYLTTEYLIRRPLGALISFVEQEEIIQSLVDILRFGEDDQVLVVPTFLYEFGLSPSVGLYLQWTDFLTDGNTIAIHGGFWGTQWLSFSVRDRMTFSDRAELTLRFHTHRRPDMIFSGIGWDATTRASNANIRFGRYEEVFYQPTVHFELRPWRSSKLIYEVGYSHSDLEDEGWRDDPAAGSVASVIGEPTPYGLGNAFSDIHLGFSLVFDSQVKEEREGSRARFRAYAEQHALVQGLPDSRWVRWGVDATLAYDVFGANRVLGVTGGVGLVTPTGGTGQIPFTSLVDPGGNGPLRGFQQGVLRGASAAVLALHYTYPIWAFLDMRLHVAVGNAFGEHFEDFDLGRCRASFGLGLQPFFPGTSDNPIEVTIAAGTEPFDLGGSLTNFRLTFGTRSSL